MVRFFVCPVGNTTHQKNPAVIPNESMERSGMNEEESPRARAWLPGDTILPSLGG